MKKLLMVAVMATVLSSCIDEHKDIDKIFSGNHELRRLDYLDIKHPANFGASYFLLFAHASGSGESTEQYISFSWKLKNGEYVLSKVPMEQIRVKFEASAVKPYISFGYNLETIQLGGRSANSMIPYIVKYGMDYVVVHCRESDYKPKIEINNIR
jgi:hypothetical protein